jgi:FG-GAP-like repeat/FG-GAP repeat
MRTVLAFLLLLALGGVSSADFPACPTLPDVGPDLPYNPNNAPDAIPCKRIRIFNNHPTDTLWVIIQAGATEVKDEWLQAWFKVQAKETDRTYSTHQVVRIYVNGTTGIPAGSSAEVTLPFYTRLSSSFDGKSANQFVDWWNGGRILFYFDAIGLKNIQDDLKYDQDNTRIQPSDLKTPGPCFKIPAPATPGSNLGCTTSPPVYAISTVLADNKKPGLPATDHSQLMEFTFADAITKGGLPFSIRLAGVGYNISSVDQVYLPVAMEALTTNPTGLVPYIGTVMDVTTFRGKLNKWLKDYEGWPVYNKADGVAPDPTTPPRIPGAYNVFASIFTGPKNTPNGDLTKAGTAVQNLIDFFNSCKASAANAGCANYNKLTKATPATAPEGLFARNYFDYVAKCGALTYPDTEMLKRIYGWVPFGFCTEPNNPKSNDLALTADELGLKFNKFQDDVYTHGLQYVKGDAKTTFNPYVQLIHGAEYLNMAAYAFSVDDAIGFQSYPGEGIIITLAGVNGLDNPNVLDPSKRVVITMGVEHPGIPEWASIALCNPNFIKPIDPSFTSVLFYPALIPPAPACTITIRDLKNAVYQFPITSTPPNLQVNKAKPPCKPDPGLAALNWCGNLVVHDVNFIDTPPSEPDPPTSTHDFNGDGKSDILLRNPDGSVEMWMMQAEVVANKITLSESKPNTWSIVGQRDFDRDGKADVLWRDSAGNSERWFLNGTGTGPNVLSKQVLPFVSPAWTVVGTGDFNQDGFGDVLWRCTVTTVGQCSAGDVAVWLMNKLGLFASSVFGGVPLTDWSIVGVGHFNADTSITRNSDILWRCAVAVPPYCAAGDVFIWFMNGTQRLQTPFVDHQTNDWTVVGIGDFNGDGFDDILWRKNSGEVEIWFMKGSQILLKLTSGPIAAGWSIALTGDFDFDSSVVNNKSDILWRCTVDVPGQCAAGDTWIWIMNGTSFTGKFVANIPLTKTILSAGAE